jgi:GNAT superfamily N-acetyltransferase
MIRRLTTTDAEGFRGLRLEMLERHPHSFGMSFEEEAGWPLARFEAAIAESAVFGGFVDDLLAGIASLRGYGMRKFAHKGTLWGMYVREAARGHGLGAALVEAVLAEARRQGLEQVLLTVSKGNQTAERLYARHGFQVFGTEPRALKHQGRYSDEVQMICYLDRIAGGS